MNNLKTQIEKIPLADLRKQLADEIAQASHCSDKLKLLLVLSELMGDARKVISDIDVKFYLSEIREQAKKALEMVENEQLLLSQEFRQDESVMMAIGESNGELRQLSDEIKSRLDRLKQILKAMSEHRNNLSLPERQKAQ